MCIDAVGTEAAGNLANTITGRKMLLQAGSTDEEQKGYSWERPPQQLAPVEVLRSIERPTLSATFGTSVPPRGLSGQIRRYAFQFSESHYGHWLPLLVADRVEAVEGIIDDIKHGHVPNFFAKKGIKAEWKHNPKKVVVRLAVTALLVTAVWSLMRQKPNNYNDD